MNQKRILESIGMEVHNFNSLYNYNNYYPIKNDENPILWRYMSLSKFINLISSQSLFFAKPKTFVDTYEGHFSKFDIDRQSFDIVHYLDANNMTLSDYVKMCREYAGVICWHMNEYESAAMWDLYLPSNEGIAIKTNYKSLMKSINDKRFHLHAGKVQYIDYKKEMASLNVFETLFYKRKSFSHENELRLITLADPIIEDGFNLNGYETLGGEVYEGTTQLDTDYGANLKCNVSELIDEVYVAPKAPQWFFNVVETTLEKYGLDKVKIIHSDLYQDLIY